MNVAEAEAYVERLLSPAPPPHRKSIFLMKDVRLFLNTLERSLDLMRSGGIDAALRREETDEAVVLTVRIPKGPRGR